MHVVMSIYTKCRSHSRDSNLQLLKRIYLTCYIIFIVTQYKCLKYICNNMAISNAQVDGLRARYERHDIG